MKSIRHSRILEIIGEHEIETQDELIIKLRESGFDVTQATVSRDIKQLGLIKTSSESGKYRYSAPRRDNASSESKFRNILHETVLSVENAENIVVIKTYSGMANAAAAAVDSLSGERIVGSLAGDDTILVVTKTDASAENFTSLIKNILGIA